MQKLRKSEAKKRAVRCLDCGTWFLPPRGKKGGLCPECLTERRRLYAVHHPRPRTTDEVEDEYIRSRTHRVGL
jgi:uncharacterized OB-fold protein